MVSGSDRDGRGYLAGAAFALAAGTMWSFGGITVRLAPSSDSWQYLVWRAIGLLVATEAWSLMRGQGLLLARFLRGSWIDLVAATALAMAAITFVFALKATSIANANFLASITPLISMMLALPILGEKLSLVSVAAIGLGIAGLVVMVGGDFGHGSLLGDLGALGSSVAFAVYSICVRLDPKRDFTAAIPACAVIQIVVCAAVTLSAGRPLVTPPQDMAMALLHGAVFSGLGIPLFNLAAPRVPAVGRVVLAQTETVLAPLWGYLFLGETPAVTTLAGGGLILSGVILTAIAGARSASTGRGGPVQN